MKTNVKAIDNAVNPQSVGFHFVPYGKSFMARSDIKPIDKTILLYLYDWHKSSDRIFPSIATIAKETGLQRRAVERRIALLSTEPEGRLKKERKGRWLRVTVRHRLSEAELTGGSHRSNEYELTDFAIAAIESNTRPRHLAIVPTVRQTDAPPVRHNDVPRYVQNGVESEPSESEPFSDSEETADREEEATEARASAAGVSSGGERSERRDGGKETNPDPNPHCAGPLPRKVELSHDEALELLWVWLTGHSGLWTDSDRESIGSSLRSRGYPTTLAWVERMPAIRRVRARR
jgi:Helix-turn-helix domain